MYQIDKTLLNEELEALHYIEDEKELEKKTDLLIQQLIILMIHDRANKDNVFWAYVFNYINKKVDFTIPAPMAVTYRKNEFYLLVNPKAFEPDWTVDNIMAIITHEGYHLLLNHIPLYTYLSKQGYHQIVNIATDCEINQMLKNLPEGCVTLETVARLAKLPLKDVKPKEGSRYYFDLLLENNSQAKQQNEQEQNNGDSNNNDQNGQGNGKSIDSHDQWSTGSGDSYVPIEETAKNIINLAAKDLSHKSSSMRGLLSGDLADLIDKLNAPAQVPWPKLLQRRMGKQIHSKRPSINRLNRRQPYQLTKKGKVNDYVMPIVCAFDVSGSVSNDNLATFYNETLQISRKLHIPIEIMQFDSEVKNINIVKDKKDIDYEVHGRGGTCFQPVFNYLKEHSYDKETMLFIFSDGFGESSIEHHGYKKYNWIITDDGKLSVENNTNPVIIINDID